MLKNPPAGVRDAARSLGQVDPLGKEMAAHCSTPVETPWTEEPGGLPSMRAVSDTTERLNNAHRVPGRQLGSWQDS